MSSSASTVCTLPLTLRENFWVIARRPPYAQRPFLSGPAMCRLNPHAAASAGAQTIPKTATWEHGRGVELLRRESTFCQRLHGCEQNSHIVLGNIPGNEHDAAVAVAIRPG